MSRRHPRLSECRNMNDLVRGGFARVVDGATTDTGYRKYGTGRLMMAAASNVIPDPQGVLADGTFWPASTATTTITANVTPPLPLPEALSGLTKCLKFENDGTADAPETATVAVTASKDYYTSIYVYAPTLGGNLTVTAENGHTFSVALTGANTGWVRYSVKSATVVAETTLKLKFAFAGGTASTVYVTGAQAVQESVLTPFFSGLTSGCTWAGTANASASTRAVTYLRYATAAIPAGLNAAATIGFRTVPLMGGAYNSGYVDLTGPTSARLVINRGPTMRFYVTEASSNSWSNAVATTTWEAGAVQRVIARLTAGATQDICVNGTHATQKAHAISPAAFTALDIGSNYARTIFADYMGPLFLAPYNLTPAQTLLLDALLAAGATGCDLAKFFIANNCSGTGIVPMDGDSQLYILR